jgi:hypothetical protein
VIAITLNFRSIEAARAALLEIPASALVSAEEAPAPKQEKAAKAAKPAPVQEVAQPLPTVAPTDVPAPVAAPVEPEKAAPSVDYPTLQKAVFALAGKSREAAAAVAASLGVKTFKELDQSKWADALEAVNERLAIIEA